MDMFKMMKDAMAMKSRLAEVEKTLKGTIVTVENNGIKITINAKSEILEVKLSSDVLSARVDQVEKNLLSILQEANAKAHAAMVEEAKKLTGGMSIPGLM